MNPSYPSKPSTRPGGKLLLASLLGVFINYSAELRAESGNAEITLDPVTVTALRFEQPITEVPANITVINRDDIIQSGATSLTEVLRDRANLHFSSLSGPASASLDARGFGNRAMQNTLVIVDGRIVTRPDIGAFNWTQFPVESIEKVEVLKGAHTALYGDRASGTVIKVTTLRGTEEPESAIQASRGSFQTENLRFSSRGSFDQVGYQAGGDYFYTDGYRDHANQRNRSANLGLDYNLTEDLSLFGNVHLLKSEYNLPGALTTSQFFDNPRQSGSFLTTFEERYVNLAGGLQSVDSGYGNFSLEGGAILRKLDNRNNFAGFANTDLDTFTLSPSWFIEDGENSLLLGVDLVRDELDVVGDTGFNSFDARLRRNRYAAYGQYSRRFATDWIASVSGRHENARLNVDYEDSNPADSYRESTRKNESAWGLGLTHLFRENARWWVRFESFYRYPATDEIAGYQGGNAFLSQNFNSDLKPETGQSIELGAELRQNNWFFSVNPFLTLLDDEIFFDSTASLNTNFDHRTLRYGSEFEVLYTEDTWGIGLQYRFLEAEERGGESKGQRIAIVPRHLLQANMTFRPLDQVRLRLGARYRGPFDSDNGGLGQQSSNPTGDLRRIGGTTTYHLDARWEVKSGLELFGAVDNLTDKLYTNFVDTAFAAFGGEGYYPENGRSFTVGARYRF